MGLSIFHFGQCHLSFKGVAIERIYWINSTDNNHDRQKVISEAFPKKCSFVVFIFMILPKVFF